jgi:hypothetical protein
MTALHWGQTLLGTASGLIFDSNSSNSVSKGLVADKSGSFDTESGPSMERSANGMLIIASHFGHFAFLPAYFVLTRSNFPHLHLASMVLTD